MNGHVRHGVQVLSLVGAGALVGTLVTALVVGSRPGPPMAGRASAADRVPVAVAAQVSAGFAPPAATSGPLSSTGAAPPVELAIPAIGVRSLLVGLRLNTDGTLQVPASYTQAGWYRDGPAPGDSGPPAIILGHVDSKTAPGIFLRLRALRAGDTVLIRRADGTSVKFTVDRLVSYPKHRFPARTVYAPARIPQLRLITCTGIFDSRSGHYLDNLVVYAQESFPRPVPAPRSLRPAAPFPPAPHLGVRVIEDRGPAPRRPGGAAPVTCATGSEPGRIVTLALPVLAYPRLLCG